jgi:hypothetical protein
MPELSLSADPVHGGPADTQAPSRRATSATVRSVPHPASRTAGAPFTVPPGPIGATPWNPAADSAPEDSRGCDALPPGATPSTRPLGAWGASGRWFKSSRPDNGSPRRSPGNRWRRGLRLCGVGSAPHMRPMGALRRPSLERLEVRTRFRVSRSSSSSSRARVCGGAFCAATFSPRSARRRVAPTRPRGRPSRRSGALALMMAWSRSAKARSRSGISAIFASTSPSRSALPARGPRRTAARPSLRISFQPFEAPPCDEPPLPRWKCSAHRMRIGSTTSRDVGARHRFTSQA